ncbi:hypothetical protein [Ideonella sp.]|uniref:hypothetical protein n=1 Tax=Ideonella sp. TaxID=1929293 RepID=UPI0035AD99D8
MKTPHIEASKEPGMAPSAAAAPEHHRAISAQLFDNSPRQATQRQAMDRLHAPAGVAPVQLKNGKKGDGKKGGDKPKVSDKEMRKRREQSRADRSANNAARYSKDAVKHQEKHLTVKEVKAINKNIKGHGSVHGGNKQNAATTKSQAEAKEATAKKIAEKKQQEKARKEKDVDKWKKDFNQDKDDEGGAGSAFGVLVSAT